MHDITFQKNTVLQTQLDTLTLKSPFLNASGPLGWFYESHTLVDYTYLGAFILKGLTQHKRQGNKGLRGEIFPHGIINSVGLENPGIDAFIQYSYPTIKHTTKPPPVFIANINGTQSEEYGYIAKKLDIIPEIQGIEINLSCPNIKNGGLHFINDHTAVKKIIQTVRNNTTKSIIVKIPYIEHSQDIRKLITIVQNNGANCISAINTIATESPTFLQIQKKYTLNHTIKGGLSGVYIKDYALHMIKTIRSYSSIPIIGSGGIASFNDVLHFLKAGANAIAIGTEALYNHTIFTRLFKTTLAYMQKNKLANIQELYTISKTIL